jgi:hypothetical protein
VRWLSYPTAPPQRAHTQTHIHTHTHTHTRDSDQYKTCSCRCSWMAPRFVDCFHTNKQIPWPQSASELYRWSNRCLSMKLVPTFAERGCQVVSVMDPHSNILDFPDRSCYFFFQVAPRLYSRRWVDPILLSYTLRKKCATDKCRDCWPEPLEIYVLQIPDLALSRLCLHVSHRYQINNWQCLLWIRLLLWRTLTS